MNGNWGKLKNLSKQQAPSLKSIKSSNPVILSKLEPLSVTGKSVALSKPKPISVTNNSSKSDPLSVTGTSIKLHSRNNPRQQLETPPLVENTALQNAKRELHKSIQPFTSNSIITKMKYEVARAENEEEQTAEITGKEVLSYGVTLLARGIKVGEATMDYLREVLPEKMEEMTNAVQKNNESKKENGQQMTGGKPPVDATQVNPVWF